MLLSVPPRTGISPYSGYTGKPPIRKVKLAASAAFSSRTKQVFWVCRKCGGRALRAGVFTLQCPWNWTAVQLSRSLLGVCMFVSHELWFVYPSVPNYSRACSIAPWLRVVCFGCWETRWRRLFLHSQAEFRFDVPDAASPFQLPVHFYHELEQERTLLFGGFYWN